MRLDVGAAGLPGLQVQVDLEASLLLAERVRDLDDERPVVLDMDLTVGAPQELQELLTGVWVHLYPQSCPELTLGDFGPFVEFARFAGRPARSACPRSGRVERVWGTGRFPKD